MSPKPQLVKRNVWLWFFLSLCTGGIGWIIYLVLNLTDLDKLSHYRKPKRAPSTEVSSGLLVVLILLFLLTGVGGIVAVFVKFQKLNKYLKVVNKGKAGVPSGLAVFFVNILLLAIFTPFTVLLSLAAQLIGLGLSTLPWYYFVYMAIVILSLLFMIFYNLSANIKWQNAYNRRVGQLSRRR